MRLLQVGFCLNRRQVLARTVNAVSALGLLSACGFALRQAPQLSFDTLAIEGLAKSAPLFKALRRQLSGTTGTRLVDDVSQAQAILVVSKNTQDKNSVASGVAGQVAEVQLLAKLLFSLKTPLGQLLIEPSELILTRNLSYTEREALAKEQEHEALFVVMQEDLALQVLRRLAAVQPLSRVR
jgi:LPS-assembly lipoprotein